MLVLEDLHWSDDANLDRLVYMARRREPARLVILGTYPWKRPCKPTRCAESATNSRCTASVWG